MSEQLQDLGKRRLLKAALGTGAGVIVGAAGGFAAGKQAGRDAGRAAAAQHSDEKFDCYGAHQAGITTPHQQFGIMAAFDVSATQFGQLENLFRILTDRIVFLTQGGTLPDTDPKLPPAGSGVLGKTIPPDGLTVTVSVGDSLFDQRFGLAPFKPKHLQEMKRFPNDKLQADWCDGDISVQICANSPETCQNALRDIIKNTTPLMTVRWSIDGFLPKSAPGSAGRNLFGFHDGSGNPDVSDPKIANEVVWTGENDNSRDEPAWAKDGSYQAVRLIRNFVEFWDRTPLQEQEAIFGRDKYTGAPLGMKHESDTPDYGKDPDGKVIPKDSHMRLANSRSGDFRKHLLYRRPFNYSLGLSKAGQLDVGLVFICYQANLQNGFIDVQNMLNGEPLEEYISPFGGGYFFTLPGFTQGQFLAQNLLAAVQQAQS